MLEISFVVVITGSSVSLRSSFFKPLLLEIRQVRVISGWWHLSWVSGREELAFQEEWEGCSQLEEKKHVPQCGWEAWDVGPGCTGDGWAGLALTLIFSSLQTWPLHQGCLTYRGVLPTPHNLM